MEKTMKTVQDVMYFGQGNLEAAMKSGQIWAAGVQELSQQALAATQASWQEQVAHFQALTSAKTLQDIVELQARALRGTMERTVSEGSRLADATIKLAEQASAPLTSRAKEAMAQFTA